MTNVDKTKCFIFSPITTEQNRHAEENKGQSMYNERFLGILSDGKFTQK